MNFTKNLKRTKIKKECIKQKFNWIINTSTLLLFFHYTGSKKYNWEIVKKEIFTNKENFNCKGLIMPSNLSALLQSNKNVKPIPAKVDQMCFNRFLGSTLLIGCQSIEQVCAIMEICKNPTFYCLGGLYDQENVLTHLDIKCYISLEKSLHLQNYPEMTPRAKMCLNLLHSLRPYSRDWLVTLQRSLHFNLPPVHLILHSALSFLALKKQIDFSCDQQSGVTPKLLLDY